MYSKLTKVITRDGKECVTCALYGTEKCHIHTENGVHDCGHCDMLGAILNQLNFFENLMTEAVSEK